MRLGITLVLFCCTIQAVTNNQNNTSYEKQKKWAKECLDTHNFYRNKHEKPELKWDKTTMFFAQKAANSLSYRCEFEIDKESPFGENLAGGNLSCKEVVDRWYKQKSRYDPKSPETSKSAGQYTQVLWKESTFLGCGVATHCKYGFVIICYYFPPGNIKDQFHENV